MHIKSKFSDCLCYFPYIFLRCFLFIPTHWPLGKAMTSFACGWGDPSEARLARGHASQWSWWHGGGRAWPQGPSIGLAGLPSRFYLSSCALVLAVTIQLQEGKASSSCKNQDNMQDTYGIDRKRGGMSVLSHPCSGWGASGQGSQPSPSGRQPLATIASHDGKKEHEKGWNKEEKKIIQNSNKTH